MPLKRYDPRDVEMEIASNTTLVLLPMIADSTLKTVSVTEIEAGVAFECATAAFGLVPSPTTREKQNLCDKDARQRPGSTTWSIEPLIIDAGDPQATNDFIDGLVVGETRYLTQRDGLPHLDAFAAGQKVANAQVTIQAVSRVPLAASTDGTSYQWRIDLAVDQVEQFATVKA